MSVLNIKVSLNNEHRRFSFPTASGYRGLLATIHELFNLNETQKERLVIRYLDEDGDYISVKCDLDVQIPGVDKLHLLLFFEPQIASEVEANISNQTLSEEQIVPEDKEDEEDKEDQEDEASLEAVEEVPGEIEQVAPLIPATEENQNDSFEQVMGRLATLLIFFKDVESIMVSLEQRSFSNEEEAFEHAVIISTLSGALSEASKLSEMPFDGIYDGSVINVDKANSLNDSIDACIRNLDELKAKYGDFSDSDSDSDSDLALESEEEQEQDQEEQTATSVALQRQFELQTENVVSPDLDQDQDFLKSPIFLGPTSECEQTFNAVKNIYVALCARPILNADEGIAREFAIEELRNGLKIAKNSIERLTETMTLASDPHEYQTRAFNEYEKSVKTLKNLEELYGLAVEEANVGHIKESPDLAEEEQSEQDSENPSSSGSSVPSFEEPTKASFSSSSSSSSSNPEEYTYLQHVINEGQFHRLILQTWVETEWEKFQRSDLKFNSSEIANTVIERLKGLGSYTETQLDILKTQLTEVFLDKLPTQSPFSSQLQTEEANSSRTLVVEAEDEMEDSEENLSEKEESEESEVSESEEESEEEELYRQELARRQQNISELEQELLQLEKEEEEQQLEMQRREAEEAEEEERQRVEAEKAEEEERQRSEAEEEERQRCEEEERKRLEAEEERQRLEAEEAERQRLEAEKAERQRLEAEEAERLRILSSSDSESDSEDSEYEIIEMEEGNPYGELDLQASTIIEREDTDSETEQDETEQDDKEQEQHVEEPVFETDAADSHSETEEEFFVCDNQNETSYDFDFSRFSEQNTILSEMGFFDFERNLQLLNENNGEVEKVILKYLEEA